MARKPLIRIALVERDPLRLVGFRAVFGSVSGFELVPASLPDIVGLQSIDLVLLSNCSVQRLFDLMASLKATRSDLRHRDGFRRRGDDSSGPRRRSQGLPP